MHFFLLRSPGLCFSALCRFGFESFWILTSKTVESFRPRDLKGCEASLLAFARASLPKSWRRCARVSL